MEDGGSLPNPVTGVFVSREPVDAETQGLAGIGGRGLEPPEARRGEEGSSS